MGRVNFNDLAGQPWQVYAAPLSATVNARVTPIGTLTQTMLLVQVVAFTPGDVTNVYDLSISVDGNSKAWTETLGSDGVTANISVSAKLLLTATLGSAHTVAISAANPFTVVMVSVVSCPWILSDTPAFPVAANSFSQGSTIYCFAEPLFNDPTKNIYVGKPRAISFGAASLYYAQASGTGIINFSYLFDIADLTSIQLLAAGLGGCIATVAVDVR